MNGLIRWQRAGLMGWPAFDRLTDLRDEIDRLFEAPLADLARSSRLLSGWTPALDVFEDKENVTVRAELPGMKREDVEVSLHENMLSISGERKHEDKHKNSEMYRAERFFGRFQRSVTLPCMVANDRVKAAYKDGILTITLPKAEEAKPKRIDVSVS